MCVDHLNHAETSSRISQRPKFSGEFSLLLLNSRSLTYNIGKPGISRQKLLRYYSGNNSLVKRPQLHFVFFGGLKSPPNTSIKSGRRWLSRISKAYTQLPFSIDHCPIPPLIPIGIAWNYSVSHSTKDMYINHPTQILPLHPVLTKSFISLLVSLATPCSRISRHKKVHTNGIEGGGYHSLTTHQSR